MQYLKEEIREQIKKEAIYQFSKKGFKDTNMREIAANCNITVGNIYRYFPSKAELLDDIIVPVLEKLKRLLLLERIVSFENINDEAVVQKFVTTAVRICTDYKREIVILISKSEGTKYEHSRDYLVNLVGSMIDSTLEKSDMELSRIIAIAVISSIHEILIADYTDEETINICTKLICYLFKKNE